jgi:hypothetical protein
MRDGVLEGHTDTDVVHECMGRGCTGVGWTRTGGVGGRGDELSVDGFWRQDGKRASRATPSGIK